MKQELMAPVPVEPELYGDDLRNDYGAIRNKFVRSHYFSDRIRLSDVVNLFKEWQQDSEYFILQRIAQHSQETLLQDTTLNHIESRYEYKFIKASKRGNDVYQHLVSKKLEYKISDLPNVIFFDEHSVDKSTCLLFVTLTYNAKKCDINTAWTNIGKEFHLFHNNLRKKYGCVEIFRTWESTQNYYPHVHCMILFWEHEFKVLEHKDKDGRTSYRIPYKDMKDIAKYWHSNVDVQAVEDTHSCVKELTKYITKDLCSSKGDKTNSMIWLFRKQGYSVSKGFKDAIKGWCIDFSEPTAYDLIDQMSNCNRDLDKWEFVGILRGAQLGFSPDMWCVDLKKPPPLVSEMIERERIRWGELHGGKY